MSLGKLVGKVIGEAVALPFTIIKEGEKAIEEAGDTISKRVDEAVEPDDDRS